MRFCALLSLMAALLSGCGQKGPLVLPNRTKPEHVPVNTPASPSTSVDAVPSTHSTSGVP